MVLARVIYELFETETDPADAADRGEPVFLDRQLRLEFTDTQPVFISWTWGLLPEANYHLAWSYEPLCTDKPEVEYDATRSPAWKDLIGHELSLHYRDPEQQVLEVRAHDAVVFCCSFGCGAFELCRSVERGAWHMDTLYVGRALPEGADDLATS